jgi:ankyrin repeat protein
MQGTVVHAAARKGHAEVIRLLAERGADMNARYHDGFDRWRPLHEAARRGRLAAVEALVDCGADQGATDANNRTARELAMRGGYDEIAEFLRERSKPR